MPELPEVETVRRTLSPLVGQRIEGVWTSGKALRLGRAVDADGLRAQVVGAVVAGVRRLGKYLLIDTESSGSILVHLGMSGRLRLHPKKDPLVAHTHVIFRLDAAGESELRYSDPRRFGQVEPIARGAALEHPSLALLGPDPLTAEVSGPYLHGRLRGSKRLIKSALLDQTLIAGIGNIYASEALHCAQILPSTPAGRVSRPRISRLAAAVREVLERALSRGGTSLKDFVAADGAAGENAHYLLVYDRAGQPCPRSGCKGRVRRTIIQGRSTFHCPSCQKR